MAPKGKAPPAGKAPTRQTSAPKTAPPKRTEPLYPLLGVKRVAFKKAAQALSNYLLETYGTEVTISYFTRALVEIRGRQDLKGKIFLEDTGVALHKAYEAAKVEMIEEQQMFRQSYALMPVQTQALPDTADDIFSGPADGGH